MTITAMDLVKEAKSNITEIDGERAHQLVDEGARLLDVREMAEYEAGHINDAVHISRGLLEFAIGQHPELSDKNRSIIVYCKSGGRSALAAASLQQLGYQNVVSLAGGFDGWSKGTVVPEGLKN